MATATSDSNPVIADAVMRARQAAASVKVEDKMQSAKRPLEDGGGPESKKSLMSLDMNPSLIQLSNQNRQLSTEEMNVPDKLVGLIIGRGGEQISRIQNETGCRVQIAPDSAGLPDRHVTLIGSPESISICKAKLTSIIDRTAGSGDPGLPPPPGVMSGLPPGFISVELHVPSNKAGLIIGKGGETIKKMMIEFGVKMYLVQESSQVTGMDKPLKISGDPERVNRAKESVLRMINSVPPSGSQQQNGGGNGNGNDNDNQPPGLMSANQGTLEFPVPKFAVGIIIGKSGETIRKIQQENKVRIQFKPADPMDQAPDKICVIEGPQDRAQTVGNIIRELVDNVAAKDKAKNSDRGAGQFGQQRGGPPGQPRGGGQGPPGRGGRPPPGEGHSDINYLVPQDKCGLVIGKGGETIRNINQTTGAHVELNRHSTPPPGQKSFIIRGSPQQIQHAESMIRDICGMPPNQGPPNGGPPHHGGHLGRPPPPIPPPGGPHGGPPQPPPGFGPPPPMGGPGGPPPPAPFGHHPPAPTPWGGSFPAPPPSVPWQPPPAPVPPAMPAPIPDPGRQLPENNSAAWAAYYQNFYQQPQSGGIPPVQGPPGSQPPPSVAPGPNIPGTHIQGAPPPVPTSGPPAASAPPPAQSQPPPSSSSAVKSDSQQPDYSAAWAEYFKQQAQAAQAAQTSGQKTDGQPDYSAAWAEYYKRQAEQQRGPTGTGSVTAASPVSLTNTPVTPSSQTPAGLGGQPTGGASVVPSGSNNTPAGSLGSVGSGTGGVGGGNSSSQPPDYSAAWADYYRQQGLYYNAQTGQASTQPPSGSTAVSTSGSSTSGRY